MKKAAPDNARIARDLREIALRLEMQGVPFKPRSYEKAADAVEELARPAAELYAASGRAALEGIPAVGSSIAAKIEELLTSGRIRELEAMRLEIPADVLALSKVEGVGPRAIRTLYEALGVKTLDELEAACRARRVKGLPRFGERAERRMLRSLDFLKAFEGRWLLGEALAVAREILGRLEGVVGETRVSVAGSLRRMCETVGDLDFVAASGKPDEVAAAFARMPEAVEVYAQGGGKARVRLQAGVDAELWVVPPERFGAALAYATGSEAHRAALQDLARKQGLRFGALAARTEEEFYELLKLPWIPPELREGRGEIEAALSGELPELVEAEDLLGDLQTQTDWTDGAATIEEMAHAARLLGWEYIAITDHTRDLAMTGGSDEKRLLAQASDIRKINGHLAGFRILSGAEVNIRRDGTLDIADEVLRKLDVVGAAVHSLFDLPREEATRRVIRAMENPNVDILFHPSSRHLGKRPPMDLDIDAVIQAAKRTGTALEVDGQPERLDLADEHVRKAVEAGVGLVVDSDAHHPAHLAYATEFGVPIARRGWARKEDILNTLPAGRLLARLKGAGA